MSGNLPNNPGMLMGNQNRMTPNSPQQQQQQQNVLQNLAVVAGRFAPQQQGANGASNLYSYGSSRTNYAALLGLEETLSEEQIKGQALNEGGTIATGMFQICATRKTSSPIYATWRAALERFSRPRKNMPQEPALVDFINDIDSNQNLHNYVLANAAVQAGSELGYRLCQGDETIRTDRSKIQDVWYRCCVDTINLQFMNFLLVASEGNQIFYRLSNLAKETLIAAEPVIYEVVANRYVYCGIPNPYSKGSLAKIMERASTSNPLLTVNDPADMGFGGNIFDTNFQAYGALNAHSDPDPSHQLNEYILARARGQNGRIETAPTHREDPSVLQSFYNDYDRPELTLEEMTRENRHKYQIDKYARVIPGTEWYLMRDDHAKLILRNLQKDDGMPFRWLDTRCVGTIPVYKLNWMEGTFNFRLIKHNLQAWDLMGTLLSNPEKLLPFMYEEDGVQKTTFDPTVLETSAFVRDNVIVPLGEMKELEKEPNILIGNRPMVANQGNDATLTRLNVLTQTYDPKGKLDAFVLPMVISREWSMEPKVDMETFYDDFKLMVNGTKHEITDTSRVLRNLSTMCEKYKDIEFVDFLRPYLTNLVNRWLIEARGYTETKAEALANNSLSYLRVEDIFTDLDDLLTWFNKNDQPTLRAFLDYKLNHFLRSGIEILATAAEVKTEYENKYKSEEDETIRAAMIKSGEKAILIKRNTVFLNMVKEAGPRSPEEVVIKQSGNPELFAIVRRTLKVVAKHFADTPQVLIRFNKDEGGKVWVATPSDFDSENVFVLRTISEGQEFCHPYPICE